jgi:membrane protease subunit HflC
MKNQFTFLVGTLVVVILVVYMFAFQVRYDEVAVLTTFEEVKDEQKDIIREPGLCFRLPWPIQRVIKYSTRLQVLEDQIEEQQTSDEKAVIIRTYLAWRISDPLRFFESLETTQRADEQLNILLRGEARGLISKFSFDQLVNTDTSKLKLGEMERLAAERLQERVNEAKYGITIEKVGVRRLVLPQKTTESVFETMKKTRQRMAENARQEGQAQAAAIKSEAESASKRMLAFAERHAQAIRSKGDREAATHYEKFAKDQDFAIFLREMEALQKMLSSNTTFVLDAKSIGVLTWFKNNPQASQR